MKRLKQKNHKPRQRQTKTVGVKHTFFQTYEMTKSCIFNRKPQFSLHSLPLDIVYEVSSKAGRNQCLLSSWYVQGLELYS